MIFRQERTILALVVLVAAACGGDDSSDENALSSDAGTDDQHTGTSGRSAAGRGGKGGSAAQAGKGGAPAAGKGGKGGASGSSAEGEAPHGGDSAATSEGGKGGASGNQGNEATGGTSAAGSSSGGSSGAGTGGAGGMTIQQDDAGVDHDDAGLPEPSTAGPYLMSGTLKGYTWIAQSGTGTTLTATGLTPGATPAPICIKGSVAATSDFHGTAIIGVNLNQAMNAGPMAFTPTLAGLQLGVTNRGGSPLRVQIQAADNTGLWCAVVSGSGGFIPWTAFNTACWDGSGTAYARQPISVAMVSVPGSMTAAVPYEFCLDSIAEAAM